MKVYHAINAVQGDLAIQGISKDRKNQQQGFAFRGIDDCYNAIASLLAKYGLVIIPRLVSRENVVRETKSGGTLNYVTVEMEFDFVAKEDGSKHTARMAGEAMDSGDKATNKAMSAAYKYLCLQTFCIPTEGDNDADATTHEAIHVAPPPALASPEQKAKLAGFIASPEVGAKLEAFLAEKKLTLNTITAKQADALIEKLTKK